MSNSSSDRNPVEQLAEEFVARRRRGEVPALSEYTQRYPQWADEILDLFPALVAMEELKPAHSQATGDFDGPIFGAGGQKLERLGDYRLLREVGRGGMGVVYEAEQVSLGRHVALKVLPGHALIDTRQLQRFRREAKAAARLHHTNIVPVFGVGEQDGLHYYVMQFIHGQGLDQVLIELGHLRQSKQPTALEFRPPDSRRVRTPSAAAVAQSLAGGAFAPPAEASPASGTSQSSVSGQGSLTDAGRRYFQCAARIGVQAAEALAHAHAQGILHRDVKPSNLLLDVQGNVWVTDFGLAKSADSDDLTHSGDIVGTIRYMAPERFSGKGDARSDVYALGLTLYEMLTLRPAFEETDRHKLMQQVMNQEPPRPRKHDPSVPRDLETIVLKAIARDPAHRYASAAEVADDLQRFVEDRPILARRISSAERLLRWCKRNPVVAGLTAAVLLLLIAVATVSTVSAWQATLSAQREKASADAAETARQEAEAIARAELEARRRGDVLLGEQFVAQGVRLQEQGDVSGAALCYAEALKRDGGDADRAKGHRIRLTAALRQCPRPTQVFFHGGEINSTALSPDGRRLATADANDVVRLWDVQTGDPIGEPLQRETPIRAVVFSADSGHLLVGGGRPSSAAPLSEEPKEPTGEATIWHLADGTRVDIPTWEPRSASVPSPLKTPAGAVRFLCCPKPGVLQSYEMASGKPVGSPLELARDLVLVEAFLSPDGERALTLMQDARSARLEDLSGSEVFLRTFRRDISLWDVRTGKETRLSVGSVPAARAGVIPRFGRNVAPRFSPDSQRVVAIGGEGAIHVWETTGKLLFAHTRRDQVASSVEFSPDGRQLLASFSNRSPGGGFLQSSALTHVVLDAQTGQPAGPPIVTELVGRSAARAGAVLSPDGSRLLTWEPEGLSQLWVVATGRQLAPDLPHPAGVSMTLFSPDGRYLVTVGSDNAVRVRSAITGRPETPLLKHETTVTQAQFTPDGSHMLTVSGGTVRLWPVLPPSPHQVTLPVPGGFAADFSADGRRVLISHRGLSPGERVTFEASVHDAATGQPVTREPMKVDLGVRPASGGFVRPNSALNADGSRALFFRPGIRSFEGGAGAGGRRTAEPGELPCRLWDTAGGRLLDLDLPRKVTDLRASFSSDGLLVLTSVALPAPPAPAGQIRTAVEWESRVWDAATGNAVGQPMRYRYSGRVGAAGGELRTTMMTAWSGDGSRFAAVDAPGEGHQVRVWDTRTGKELQPPLRHPDGRVITQLLFSDDGRRLATQATQGRASPVTGPGTVVVWDAETGARLSEPVPCSSADVALNWGGDRVASVERGSPQVERDLVVQVRDVQTGRPVSRPLVHERPVTQMEFSPDGSQLLTASRGDGTVRIWDAATGDQLRVLRHELAIIGARFSADGRRVVTNSGTPLGFTNTGFVQVWDAATGQPLTPPLQASRSLLRNVSRDVDRMLLGGTSPEDGVRIFDLSADSRPIEELVALAEVLAARAINTAGAPQTLEPEQFRQAWRTARQRFPDDWGRPPLQGLAWHNRQASGQFLVGSPLRGSSDSESTWQAHANLWHLERLIAAEKDNPELLADRAYVYQTLGQWQKVIADCTAALERSPENGTRAYCLQTRGQAHAELARWREAEDDYVRASEIIPQPPDTQGTTSGTFVALALLRLQRGDHAGYQKACAKLLEFFNRRDQVAGPSRQAVAWPCLLAQGGVTDADYASLGSGARGFGGNRNLFELGGAARYRQEKYGEAEELLKRLSADTAGNRFFLAMAQAKNKKPDEARKSLDEGIKLMNEPATETSLASFQGEVVQPWQRRLAEQILRQEAEGVLKEAKP